MLAGAQLSRLSVPPARRSRAASAAKCAEGRDLCSKSPHDRKYTESGRRATAEQLPEEGRGTAVSLLP